MSIVVKATERLGLTGCLCRFVPKYFDQDISTGIPKLTEEGRKALEEELAEKPEHQLEESTPTSRTPSSGAD